MLAGLAEVGVLFASVLTGVCLVLSARSHWSGMTERARRFVRSQERPSDEVGSRYLLAVRGEAHVEPRVDEV